MQATPPQAPPQGGAPPPRAAHKGGISSGQEEGDTPQCDPQGEFGLRSRASLHTPPGPPGPPPRAPGPLARGLSKASGACVSQPRRPSRATVPLRRPWNHCPRLLARPPARTPTTVSRSPSPVATLGPWIFCSSVGTKPRPEGRGPGCTVRGGRKRGGAPACGGSGQILPSALSIIASAHLNTESNGTHGVCAHTCVCTCAHA